MKIAGVYTTKRTDPSNILGIDEPLGLEMVLGIAMQGGHEVDLFCDDVKGVIDFKPDLVAFSATTSQIPRVIATNTQIKRKMPSVISLLGGYHASAVPEVIRNGFDYVVIGEGEETFRELIRAIRIGENPISIGGINGIAFKNDREIVVTPRRERILDLDVLPAPFRTDKVLDKRGSYLGYPEASRRKVAYMEWERGCPYSCNFCASPQVIGRSVSYRTPEKVVQEIKRLQQEFGVNSIFFTDLNMSVNRTKFAELLKSLKTANLGISWSFMTGFTNMDDEALIRGLKEAGCTKISWGIESLTDDPKLISKQTTKLPGFKRMQEVLEKTASQGLINEGFYILGWPGEKREEISQATSYLRQLNLHCLRPTIYTPFPGTGAYADLREKLTLPIQWENFDTNHLVFSHPNGLTEKELRSQQQRILSSFYHSKEYRARIRDFVKANPSFEKAFQEFSKSLGEVFDATK